MDREKKQHYRKWPGSFTVEASLLMGILLPVLFLIIQMTLFLTDTVRMGAVLSEQTTVVCKDGETISDSRERKGAAYGFFLLEKDRIQYSVGKDKVTAAFGQDAVNLGFHWKRSAEMKFEKELRSPVKFIRIVQRKKEE